MCGFFSVVLFACFNQEKDSQKNESSSASEESCEKKELAQQAFVFGQNLRDRVKVCGQKAG